MKRIILILTLSIVCWNIGLANEPPSLQVDTLKIYDLADTIVVIANRFELPLKHLTYTHQVVDRAEMLALSKHSALEAVDFVYPSAYTVDKKIIGYGVGAEGGGSINIRGQGGKPNTGLLVLINGHPDFMGIFGHPLPDVYGTDDIQQVEILSGPASTVFGSQAMGGIININTHPDFEKSIRISAEAGSYRTYNTGLNLTHAIDQGGLFLSGRYQQTGGHTDQTDFKSVHLMGGFEFPLNAVWRISGHTRYVPYEFDDPARGENDPAGLGTYGKIRRGTGELILENQGTAIHGSSQVYGNLGHHRFYDGFESRDFTYGVSSYQQWTISDIFNLSLGGDFMYYGGQGQNTLVPPGVVNDQSHTFNSLGLYSLVFYSGLSGTTVKFGLRYQYHSLPLNNLAPVFGITYNLLTNLRLYGNYQFGFRYPTMNELYLFPPANPDLEDERIRSVEGGLWYYWAGQNALRLSYYQNDVDNIILLTPNPSPPPPMQYSNSGKAKQHGLEIQLNLAPLSDLGIQISYSYLDPDDITAYNPKNQFKYIGIYRYGPFKITLSGKYVADLYGSNNYEMPLPDYHLLNLTSSLEISGAEIYIKFQNILDRKYFVYITDSYEYPAPGFHMLAGFRWGL